MTIRVLLTEDHTILRQGLRALLEGAPDIEVVAEAEDGRTAVRLAKELTPDIVVMDVVLPELNGVEATRQILASRPEVRVVALSMHGDRRYLREMLKAGARAYVLKDAAFEELVRAIEEVAAGRTFLGTGVSDVLVADYVDQRGTSEAVRSGVLSQREREVLQLLAEGSTTREIAGKLHVNVKTVETHRRQIMTKLELHSIAALTKYAIREGITSVEE